MKLVLGIILAGIIFYAGFQFANIGGEIISMPRTVELKSILNDPAHYDGQKVQIEGEVISNVALFGIGAYQVKQGDNEILVVGSNGIPKSGTHIIIAGIFKQAFAIGGTQYSVIIEKH